MGVSGGRKGTQVSPKKDKEQGKTLNTHKHTRMKHYILCTVNQVLCMSQVAAQESRKRKKEHMQELEEK